MLNPQQHVILSNAKDPSGSNAVAHGFFASLRMTGLRAVSLPARAVSGLIWIYQQAVSPTLAALHPTCGCRFTPTCSHYAREALREHGLLAGIALTVRRLVQCGPWHPGGLDPVPSRQRPVCKSVAPVSSLITRHSSLS